MAAPALLVAWGVAVAAAAVAAVAAAVAAVTDLQSPLVLFLLRRVLLGLLK